MKNNIKKYIEIYIKKLFRKFTLLNWILDEPIENKKIYRQFSC